MPDLKNKKKGFALQAKQIRSRKLTLSLREQIAVLSHKSRDYEHVLLQSIIEQWTRSPSHTEVKINDVSVAALNGFV